MPDDPIAATDAGDAPQRVRPVDLRDYVDFSPDVARRVRVFRTATHAIDLWCLEPQQSTPVLHLADADLTYTVLGGRSWFVTDEGEIGLDPLGAMLVPAGVVHGIDNRGADPLIVAVAVAPPGEGDVDAPATDSREAVRGEEAAEPGPLRRMGRGLLRR